MVNSALSGGCGWVWLAGAGRPVVTILTNTIFPDAWNGPGFLGFFSLSSLDK
jgi:hypothetical protein